MKTTLSPQSHPSGSLIVNSIGYYPGYVTIALSDPARIASQINRYCNEFQLRAAMVAVLKTKIRYRRLI